MIVNTVVRRLTIASTYEKPRIRIAFSEKFLPILRTEIQDTNRKILAVQNPRTATSRSPGNSPLSEHTYPVSWFEIGTSEQLCHWLVPSIFLASHWLCVYPASPLFSRLESITHTSLQYQAIEIQGRTKCLYSFSLVFIATLHVCIHYEPQESHGEKW